MFPMLPLSDGFTNRSFSAADRADRAGMACEGPSAEERMFVFRSGPGQSFFLLTLACLVIAASSACGGSKGAPPAAPPTVEVAPVERRNVAVTREWIGS